MADRITANLPSRDFDRTEAFYGRLGFIRGWRDTGWMILRRGPLELEFFPHPEVDPLTSWFSACVRVDDLDALHALWRAAWRAAGLSEDARATPRLSGLFKLDNAPRMFVIVDEDGTLLRILDNGD